MLHSAPESFHIAKCIGYRNDIDNPHRTGLVYRVPQNFGIAVPISLLDIIKRYREAPTPPLGDRFKLAQKLATTLMQLHTSDWLHKAFRSDNVLFFSGLAGSTTDPYVAGFEYARDMKMQSLGMRPNGQNSLDYYYHPDVVNGFSKTLDLYSLGVVLLEIAYWRPLRSKIPDEHATSLESIHRLFVESADQRLDAAVGSIYAGVVRTCLQRKLQDTALGAGFACAINTEIVLQLERCVA
jgi:serine/threonine protein kinase